MRQPLQNDQPDSLREMVKFLSLHAPKVSEVECVALVAALLHASKTKALAKVDCKALHPFWVVLLPVHTPLARRPDSLTLMDAIVNDPAPKVRAAAAATLAALLEGAPQRAYLGIAECRSSANQPVRGFTTLSATLGKLALSLHDGLLQDAASEAHPAALTAVLRALHDVHRCSARLQKGSRRAVEEAAAAQAAALSCIAAALNANASRGHLSELLLPGHSASADDAQPQGFGPRLADDLLQLCAGVSSAVKAEALSALQALAMGHRGLLKDHWDSLKSVMVSSLESGGEERCALNALRLLGSYLKGEEHNVPAVRAAALTALASLDETARAALSSSQLQRLWGWLFDSAEIECNTAVRNAALKTAGTLAQLRCSLEYPGAAAMLGIFDAGLQDRWPTLSVQIAAAWALANLADTVTQSPTPAPELCSSIAHAALGAANAGDKMSSGQPPDWFVRGLGCLHEALASGNGKVQWNACYAIGALLRSAAAAAAADACGGLQPLLAQLLDVLQHGANFKTRMHAAAALCAVKDGRLILQLQPDVVSRLKSALQGLDGSHDQGAESPGPPGQADWPVLGQESLQNLQSLYPLKEQLHATLQHIEELLKST
ncbi:hypothetical protein COCSUDRAFT_39464 [Coccomyxa subellipsoidea C-169]|uniref:DUF4042 domain-containing protein n=1 Tax=Coccomyxa subellipsoidea (strain C-169) TaxID=574566 RepID=I0Z6S9_COCSC|nr:hypothetical protein COCSUDRAFT_39464 [Coccomyxa subellipsoidea C-169]EIE26348.1 hypothetical protein COCSUDRAFT_39464 [Coccomyxa subellipsoidea C-169]|eukprot:XP_005650892.1 hypothetical protein COCSUDRAFT_39464 [Coccomyxa subellipsoidea C-169]